MVVINDPQTGSKVPEDSGNRFHKLVENISFN